MSSFNFFLFFMDENHLNFPIFLKKTIKEESSFSSVIKIKNNQNIVEKIFYTHNSKLFSFHVQNHSINLEFDFSVKIIAISNFKIENENDSILVILENFNYYVLNSSKIIGKGTLKIYQQLKLSKKFILPTTSYLNKGSFSSNFYINNCIRFYENKVLIISNEFYCIVHIFSNIIHIFNFNDFKQNPEDYKPIIYRIYLQNIIQICFLESSSTSQFSRIAILSDCERKLTEQREFNPNELNRNLLILEINNTTNEIQIKNSIELTPDCHYIYPIISNGNTIIIGFTFQGIIKIIANSDIPPTTEIISCNVDKITLLCEHFIDDLYFLYGASGIIQIARFSHNSPPNIEILNETSNIITSLITIDQHHLMIFETFNDVILYQISMKKQGISFNEIYRQKEISHISQLLSISNNNNTQNDYNTNNIESFLCLTGNGKKQELINFSFINSCTETIKIQTPNCLNIFSCILPTNSKLSETNENLQKEKEILLCLSFLNSSQLLLISNNNEITNYSSLHDFVYSSNTLYFCLIKLEQEQLNAFLQITENKILLIFQDTNEETKIMEFNDDPITHVSVYNETICIMINNTEFIYLEVENKNIQIMKKFKISNETNCLFISHKENYCSILYSNHILYIYNLVNDEIHEKQLHFDLFDLPSSLQITYNPNNEFQTLLVLIGTNSGKILTFNEKFNKIKTYEISEDDKTPIKMNKTESNSIIFFSNQNCGQITDKNEYNLIDINNSNEIISVDSCSSYFFILQENYVSIYQIEKHKSCKSSKIQEYPNAFKISFSKKEKKVFVLERDQKLNFSIDLYDNYTKLITRKETKMQFSLFTFLEEQITEKYKEDEEIQHNFSDISNQTDIQDEESLDPIIDPISGFLILGTSDNYLYLYDSSLIQIAETKTQNIATCAQLIHNKIFVGEGKSLAIYDLNLEQIQIINPSLTTLISTIDFIHNRDILILGDHIGSIQLFSFNEDHIDKNLCNDYDEKGISHMITIGNIIFTSTFDNKIVIFLFTDEEKLYGLCQFSTNSPVTSFFKQTIGNKSIFYSTEDGGIYQLSIVDDSIKEKLSKISDLLDQQNLEFYKNYDTKLIIDTENLKNISLFNDDKKQILLQNGFESIEEFE